MASVVVEFVGAGLVVGTSVLPGGMLSWFVVVLEERGIGLLV